MDHQDYRNQIYRQPFGFWQEIALEPVIFAES
jgi:hypothetical protein